MSYPDDLLLVVAGGVLLWLCCGCFCFGAVGLSCLGVCLVSALSPGQVVPLGCSFLHLCLFLLVFGMSCHLNKTVVQKKTYDLMWVLL